MARWSAPVSGANPLPGSRAFAEIGYMPQDRNVSQPGWLAAFPVLAAIEEPAWREALATARVVTYPSHTTLYQDGEPCEHFILILSGTVKVEKISGSGQEIALYHLRPGHICELTTSCLMSGKCYHADAITETEVRAVLIPKAAFQKALAGSPQFQRYMYAAVEQGMSDLVSLLETVITTPMGARLAHYLIGQGRRANPIATTHYEIATELGTAREVVSRLLKELEDQGCIRRRRARIEVVDFDKLRAMAGTFQPPDAGS